MTPWPSLTGALSRLIPAVVAFGLVAAACSGSDDEATTEASSESAVDADDLRDGLFEDPVSATTPAAVVSCSTASVDVPDDWPFAIADDVRTAQVIQTGERFVLLGATVDSEQVLIDTLDRSFPDFTPGEPAGGVDDIIVVFTSADGDAVLEMEDIDADGCWTVRIAADYGAGSDLTDDDLELPPVVDDRADAGGTDPDGDIDGDAVIDTGDGAGDAVTDDGDPSNDGDPSSDVDVPTSDAPEALEPPETIDPIIEAAAVGRGEMITARGTFPLVYTACSTSPLLIDGVSTVGRLEIRGDGDRVEVELTYDDDDGEVVISDDDANVLGLDVSGGTIVADGENPDGPETLFVTFMCDPL